MKIDSKQFQKSNLLHKWSIHLLLVVISVLLALNLINKQGLFEGLKFIDSKQLSSPPIAQETAIPTISPSPTPTPTPTPTQVINKPANPSDRALKVAGTVYALYNDEERRQKIRQLAGIPKSNENTEIIQYALWFDKNPGYLAKIEAAIEEYRLQQLKTQIDVPPPLPAESNLRPLNCTSNTIGNYTYTNCY